MSNSEYLTDKHLAERYGVGRATIWRWVKDENFPHPIKLSQGCTRWKLVEVEAWESQRNNTE